MAKPAAVLTILVEAQTKAAQAQLAKLQSELKASGMTATTSARRTTTATNSMATSLRKTGRTATAFGKSWTKYVGLPILAVGAYAVKSSIDFEKSMTAISTQAGATRQEVQRMTKAVLDFSASGKTEFQANDLAKALYHIESVGMRGTKAMKTLHAASDLAAVGQADLEDTTYALVSAMESGIKGAKNMHQAIGNLNAIVGHGDMRMQDLTAALSSGVLPAAKSWGLGIRDVGAALDVITARGTPAQQAATRLRMTFSLLGHQSTSAAAALKSIGINQADLAETMQHEGLIPAVKMLADHLQQAGDKAHQAQLLSEAFGGGKTSAGIITLVQNVGDLQKKYDEVSKSAGNFHEKLKETQQTPAFKLHAELAQLQTVMIRLGNKLLPVVIPLLEKIGTGIEDIANAFEGLPSWAQSWVVKLGLAALALGPIVRILGGILTMSSKIALAFGGMSAAGTTAGTAAGVGAAGAAETGFKATVATMGARLAGVARVGLAVPIVAGLVDGVQFEMQKNSKKLADRVAQISGEGGLFGDMVRGFENLPGVGDVMNTLSGGDTWAAQTAKADALLAILKKMPAASDKQVVILKAQARALADSLGLAKSYKDQIDAAAQRPGRGLFVNELGQLKSKMVTSMKDIQKITDDALNHVNKGWDKGTKTWQLHVVQALNASNDAIRHGMKRDDISTQAGLKQIAKNVQTIRIVTGSDPWKLITSFATTWVKAKKVTSGAVKDQIALMEQMPPAFRQKMQDAMIATAQALESKGQLVKGSADRLRSALVTKFGDTGKHASQAFARGLGHMGGVFENLWKSISGALGMLGTKLNIFLQAVGKGPVAALNVTKSAVGDVKGLFDSLIHFGGNARGGIVNRAQGGLTRVPGTGLQDTVPLSINGKMSAVVAPGEKLAVFNRHQEAFLNSRLRDEGGLGGFFRRHDRPHYMAGGGVADPFHVTGAPFPQAAGQGVMDKAWVAAYAFAKKHRPKPSQHGGVPGYTGPPANMKQLGDNAWVDSHTLAATAAMDKKFGLSMTSGWRSVAYETQLNPSVGASSLHTHGSPSNPGATDSAGASVSTLYRARDWAAQHIAGLQEALVDNVAGWNTHLGFFAKGGIANFAKGKSDPGDTRFGRRSGGGPRARRGTGSPGNWKAKPRTLNRVTEVANFVNRLNLPYHEWGHQNGSGKQPLGSYFDCSSAISYLMQQSGWHIPTLLAADFQHRFHAGRGKDFTILASPSHVYSVINGKTWGAMHEGTTVGYGWPYTYLPGYHERHPRFAPGGGRGGGGHGKRHGGKGGGHSSYKKAGGLWGNIDSIGAKITQMVGGNFSKDQAATLAHAARLPHPGIFGKITVPESGGDPSIVNSIGATGLWQILSATPFDKYGLTNPVVNAYAAKYDYHAKGDNFSAWDASKAGWEGLSDGHVIPSLAKKMRALITGSGGGGGLTDKQKHMRELARRKADREAKLKQLRKAVAQSANPKAKDRAYWRLLEFWANQGVFGTKHKDALTGGVGTDGKMVTRPGASETTYFLAKIRAAAEELDPKKEVPKLADIAKWALEHGDITGHDLSNSKLGDRFDKAKKGGHDKGLKEAQKIRDRKSKFRHTELAKSLLPRGVKIPASAKKLPAEVRALLARGVPWGTQQSLADMAVTLAEGTTGSIKDDRAARKFQLDIEKERIHQIMHRLAIIGKQLKNPKIAKVLRKPLKNKQAALIDDLIPLSQDVHSGYSALVGATDSTKSSDAAALLRTLLDQANLRTAVSQAQYAVLGGMPFGGSFGDGGTVPGPLGAPRVVVAHGGEEITPPGAGGGVDVHLHFADGMQWLERFVDVRVEKKTGKMSRGGRSTPGARRNGLNFGR